MNDEQSLERRGFPITLRNARERAGFTQRELGARSGVNFSQISRYEQGLAYPRPGMMLKLAEALGVSAEYLKEGEHLVHVDLVNDDGLHMRFAFPGEDMEFVRYEAEKNGRTVEEQILLMINLGFQAIRNEAAHRPEVPPPKRPSKSKAPWMLTFQRNPEDSDD